MIMMAGFPFSILSLWICFGSADANNSTDPKICYILDAVLFIYGVILTVLYCRMKLQSKQVEIGSFPGAKDAGEGVYEGLKPHDQDTYETISKQKGKQ
ncbi:high affinity immunoglobulin epsilon receptor subunit gamma-like [Xyrauchen texanus]|uniref:high affinity immunoglobulin epsilon receptor subunit gamma-like n=1 Tax=Xyrauchen texanus TaxID=154827 RepID=UPI00224243A8|nr:high affinity immunoglobulin epsilon receptor subunit gamma-like [Xyrauchen texanus]